MSLPVNTIMLGVEDLDHAEKSYAEDPCLKIDKEYAVKFRTLVEPPEPMRGLEVPPEVVQALGGGARPPVTITVNGHSWKSRVAIMRGRHLLGLSNANRQAAGVAIGEEVEVELELDSEPRVVVEPADFARLWTTTRSPAPRTTTLRTATSASMCAPSRARRRPRRADGASRRPSPPCGADPRKQDSGGNAIAVGGITAAVVKQAAS